MFVLLAQVFPYPNYTTNFGMNVVSLFMPLLVMLGLMYSAMTIIKVVQLQWNPFLIIIVLCWNIFNSLSSQNIKQCLLGQGVFLSMKQNKLSYNVSWKIFGLLNIQKSPNLHLLHVFDISVLYTCQLFLRYKREIFILWVLGFFKTTRSFPKIPEEVRRSSEDVRSLSKAKLLLFTSKIRDREEGIVIYSFYTWFSFVTWVWVNIFLKIVSSKTATTHIFQSGVRNWPASVSRREIEVFNPQAWDSRLRRESWQV